MIDPGALDISRVTALNSVCGAVGFTNGVGGFIGSCLFSFVITPSEKNTEFGCCSNPKDFCGPPVLEDLPPSTGASCCIIVFCCFVPSGAVRRARCEISL